MVIQLAKDPEHLLRFKEFIGCPNKTTSVKDPLILDLAKKFSISSTKTYNPPKAIPIPHSDLFICLFVGFIDGDGGIYNLHNRDDFSIKLKCHSSWLDILDWFSTTLGNLLQTDLPKAKINKAGYTTLDISNTTVSKFLKEKALELGLPIMRRKWDIIDLSYESRHERARKMIALTKMLMEEGRTDKEIRKILGIKPAAFYNMVRRNHLRSVKDE